MTMRPYNNQWSFSKYSHDYRGLPVLYGTQMDTYREHNNNSLVNYFVIRNLSFYRNLRNALVNKEYDMEVTIEGLWKTRDSYYERWLRVLRNSTDPTTARKYTSYNVINYFGFLYRKHPAVVTAVSGSKLVDIASDPVLAGFVQEFYKSYQKERAETRKTLRLPVTYILDSVFSTFNREQDICSDWIYKHPNYSSLSNVGKFQYIDRKFYLKQKKEVRELPTNSRPHVQHSTTRAIFFKYLLNALFPTTRVKTRKKKAQAKRAVYFFNPPGTYTDFFYFDIDDTVEGVLRDGVTSTNREGKYLIPGFLIREGTLRKCPCCDKYDKNDARHYLPHNSNSFNALTQYKATVDFYTRVAQITSSDLAIRKSLLEQRGEDTFLPYTLITPVVQVVSLTSTRPPAIDEIRSGNYPQHIQQYLTAEFGNTSPVPPAHNDERLYIYNTYTAIIPFAVTATSRYWKIKGHEVSTQNLLLQPANHLLLNGAAGDSSDQIRWRRNKAVGSGEVFAVCTGCTANVNSIYSASDVFLAGNRTPRESRTSVFGNGVIRNYTYNPMDTYPGFKTSKHENQVMSHLLIDRSRLVSRNKSIRETAIVPGGDFIDRTLYMGVELEVTPNRHAYNFVRNKLGSVDTAQGSMFASQVVERYLRSKQMGVIKADGSTTYGFEIVTVPGTLAWHKEAWKGFFKEDYNPITEYLAPASWLAGWVNNGVILQRAPWEPMSSTTTHVTPTCGIHIHVSKDALTPLQLGKILTFMGDPDNLEFIRRIAGRNENAYSQFYKKKVTEGYQIDRNLNNTMRSMGVRTNSDHETRYSAVNLTTNKPTIEFRIFRSNVAKGGFMKNLDFVHALCSWCAEVSVRDLTPDNFLKYVEAHRGTYTWFYRWCVDKKLLTTRHTFDPLMSFASEETLAA